MEFIGQITAHEFIVTTLRTIFIFAYSFIILRLLGRKRLAHLTYMDILLIIALGSAVGDVMIYGESVVHMFSSVVAITVVAIMIKVLDEFSSHYQSAEYVLEGKARLLIDNGKIIDKALAKENISKDMLMSFLRQRDVQNITSVKKVFIEPDGELSLVLQKRKPNGSRKNNGS